MGNRRLALPAALMVSVGMIQSASAAEEMQTPESMTQPGAIESTGPTFEPPQTPAFGLPPPGAAPFAGVSDFGVGIPVPESGAAGLRLGPLSLTPALAAGLRYDDNIFLSNANKRDSFISVVSPSLRVDGRRPNTTFDVTYRGEYANYWNSSADNYDDHLVRGNINWAFSGRAGLGLRAEYLRGHDPRGSTDRPSGFRPDRWDSKSVSGLFAYGAPGARGRLEVEGGYLERRYENNRLTTIGADRDITYAGGTFFWRVMPRTSLLFQARETKIDYTLSTSLFDSTEQRLLVGATWEATAKTTGIFKLGRVKKDFDSPGLTGYSGIGWEGTVRWSPLTYSNIQFTTAKQPAESSGVGNFILSRLYYLVWTHAWSERVNSSVSAGYRKDDFRGATTLRSDDTYSAGLRLSYRMRRWLELSAAYTYTERSSDVPLVDYNRNVVMFAVGVTL